MIDVIECPICSAKIRRQKLTSIAFVNRFVSHTMTHWSIGAGLEE